jgi:hypothetical protein
MASSTWFIIPLHGAKSHNSKLITYDPYDLICQNIYFFNFGISFRDFYFYKTAASPGGFWWVRFQKKTGKMHRSLRSIGLLCCLCTTGSL